jgi:hypothetical protein
MIVHCYRQMSHTQVFLFARVYFCPSYCERVKEKKNERKDGQRQKRQIEAPRQHKRTKGTYSIAARASFFLSVSYREKTNLQQHGKQIAVSNILQKAAATYIMSILTHSLTLLSAACLPSSLSLSMLTNSRRRHCVRVRTPIYVRKKNERFVLPCHR